MPTPIRSCQLQVQSLKLEFRISVKEDDGDIFTMTNDLVSISVTTNGRVISLRDPEVEWDAFGACRGNHLFGNKILLYEDESVLGNPTDFSLETEICLNESVSSACGSYL